LALGIGIYFALIAAFKKDISSETEISTASEEPEINIEF